LRSQLIAEEVAQGHAFEKHVVERGEFLSLGIRTREQFQSHVEGIVNNPEIPKRYAVDGTTYYLVLAVPLPVGASQKIIRYLILSFLRVVQELIHEWRFFTAGSRWWFNQDG
jgi:hypothetical protein